DAYWLYEVPFVDFGAIIDPPSVDVSGHAVELLAKEPGYEESVRRGVDYLLAKQGGNGSWFGRWGVNYVYGTGAALAALAAAGTPAVSGRTVAPPTGAREVRSGTAAASRPPRRPPGRSSGSSPPERPNRTR